MNTGVHTPGQWHAAHWSIHAATTVLVDDESIVTGKRVIAECESEADARLIAAAPELLLACQGLLHIAETGAMSLGAVRAARAAIAKATGSTA